MSKLEDRTTGSRPRAYLASALTGLSDDARRRIFELSDLVARACLITGFDLYEPRRMTDPVHHPEVPDVEVFVTDRGRVLDSQIIIFLADEASTGAGQELAIAKAALLPVVVIGSIRSRISRMITGCLAPGDTVLRYDAPHEVGDKLLAILERHLSQSHPAVVPDRRLGPALQAHRLRLGFTTHELASRINHGHGITALYLASLESSADHVGNPSLVELRAIATALGIPVDALIG